MVRGKEGKVIILFILYNNVKLSFVVVIKILHSHENLIRIVHFDQLVDFFLGSQD